MSSSESMSMEELKIMFEGLSAKMKLEKILRKSLRLETEIVQKIFMNLKFS